MTSKDSRTTRAIRRRLGGNAILVLGLLGCAHPAPPASRSATGEAPTGSTDESMIVAEIDAVYRAFSRGYAELDVDLVADLYTENALYLSPSRDIDRGRATIRENFRGMFERTRQKGETLQISFERIDRAISGHLAYEVGYYTLVRTGPDGSSNVSRGKFTVVLMRGADGKWRFQVDGYSAAPPPG